LRVLDISRCLESVGCGW